MKSAYQTIRRPVITEKGLGVKETQHTVVFEVAVNATKSQIFGFIEALSLQSRPLYLNRLQD